MFMIFLKWSNLYAHSAYFVFQEAKVLRYMLPVRYTDLTFKAKSGSIHCATITKNASQVFLFFRGFF